MANIFQKLQQRTVEPLKRYRAYITAKEKGLAQQKAQQEQYQQQLEEYEKAEAEYQEYLSAVEKIRKEEEEWVLAQRFVERNIPPRYVGGSIGGKMQQIYKEQSAINVAYKRLAEQGSEYLKRFKESEQVKAEMEAQLKKAGFKDIEHFREVVEKGTIGTIVEKPAEEITADRETQAKVEADKNIVGGVWAPPEILKKGEIIQELKLSEAEKKFLEAEKYRKIKFEPEAKPSIFEKASEWLGTKVIRPVEEFIMPIKKEERLTIETAFNKYQKDIKEYNQDIANFEIKVKNYENKYADKVLEQKEYDKAEQQRQKLSSEYSELTNRGELLNAEVSRIEGLPEKFRLEAKKLRPTERLASGFAIGAVTAIPKLAQLGIKFVAKPVPTFLEFGKGIAELPKEIAKKPYYTIGEIAGTVATYYGIGKLLKIASGKAEALTKVKKEPTAIRQSISKSKAMQIGTDAQGNPIWKVQSTVRTEVVSPKTFKVYKVLKSRIYTEIVTSATKEGAIRGAINSWALMFKQGAMKVFMKEPKVTIKSHLGRATGEVIMKPTEAEAISQGIATLKFQLGEAKIKVTPRGWEMKAIMRKPIKYRAISEMFSKKIATYPEVKYMKYKPLEHVKIRVKGIEELYETKAISLTQPYLKRVKGYVRGAPNIDKILKVQPYERLYPTTTKLLKGVSQDYAKVFYPKEITVSVKQLPKYKPFKITQQYELPKPVFKPTAESSQMTTTIQKTLAIQQQKAVAKVTGTAVTQQWAQVMKHLVKPEVYTKVKVTQRVFPVEALALTSRQYQQQRKVSLDKLRLLPATISIVEPRLKAEEQYVTKQREAILGALGTTQLTAQIPKPTIPTPIIPTPPPIIVTPTPTIPPRKPTITYLTELEKRREEDERRRRKYQAQLRRQQRQYQASLGSALLGIKAGKLPKQKKFTGFELRPVIVGRAKQRKMNNTYLKNLQKVFKY